MLVEFAKVHFENVECAESFEKEGTKEEAKNEAFINHILEARLR